MLFTLNDSKKQEIGSLKRTTFHAIHWKEKDLENLIAANIETLIPENQLMVVSQETQWQEAADILAFDKDGGLHIFELKRWEGKQENILQVMRYGQKYGQYKYDQFQNMINKSPKFKAVDLATAHYQYFKESRDNPLEKSEFNRVQHLIIITNGTDWDTRNAIKFWHDSGLKIASLIYRVYSIGDKNILEFNPYNPGDEEIMDGEEGYYIVNTNLAWRPTAYLDMLNQQKAAAYGGRKFSIKRIKKGNTVFLYQNGVGVIAYGKTTDHYQTLGDDEIYVPVHFEWKIDPDKESDKAISAGEINTAMESQYSFRQTVFSIQEKMAIEIKQLASQKQ